MGFNSSIEDMKRYVEPTIPAWKYSATITNAEYKVNDNNGRNMLSVALKINDSVPSGQDFDADLFLDPYDSMFFDTIMETIPGDHPFFAKNCKAKMRDFMIAVDTDDAQAMIGMNVEFLVGINKKSKEAEIKTYFKA